MKRPSLTKAQHAVLMAVLGMIAENGYSPSLAEIGREVGLSSSATIYKHLNALQAKGYIRRDYNKGRSIAIIPAEPDEISDLLLDAYRACFGSSPQRAFEPFECYACPATIRAGGTLHVWEDSETGRLDLLCPNCNAEWERYKEQTP